MAAGDADGDSDAERAETYLRLRAEAELRQALTFRRYRQPMRRRVRLRVSRPLFAAMRLTTMPRGSATYTSGRAIASERATVTDEQSPRGLAQRVGTALLHGLSASCVRVPARDGAPGPAERGAFGRQHPAPAAVGSARMAEQPEGQRIHIPGGGGTDMGAGIAAAATLRPRPAVIVVLTDGYTPWPDEPPRGSKVVVGLLGDDAPDAPTWARAIRVPSELTRHAAG